MTVSGSLGFRTSTPTQATPLRAIAALRARKTTPRAALTSARANRPVTYGSLKRCSIVAITVVTAWTGDAMVVADLPLGLHIIVLVPLPIILMIFHQLQTTVA